MHHYWPEYELIQSNQIRPKCAEKTQNMYVWWEAGRATVKRKGMQLRRLGGHLRKMLFYVDANFQIVRDEITLSKYCLPSSNPTWSGTLAVGLST